MILYSFRAEREKRTGNCGPDLENGQYNWCAEKMKCSAARVRKVVDQWIFTFPNRFLAECLYPGARSLFQTLKENDIKIAIYSDYKADDKLEAMGLPADLIVSSTDHYIDRFKPDPAAVNYIMDSLGVTREECLFVGDREELDGQCAINAGIPSMILNRNTHHEQFYNEIEKNIRAISPVEY